MLPPHSGIGKGNRTLAPSSSATVTEAAVPPTPPRPADPRASSLICARLGEVACAKLLLELGANPNADDIKGRTCLHEACDAYAADDAGDLKREDVLVALVDGGAVSLECLRGKLPDPGGDAGALVSSGVQRAFAAGKQARKDQKEVRKAKRKAKMDAIFSNAIHKVVANASACAITVMDTGDGDGYKYGSRDGAR